MRRNVKNMTKFTFQVEIIGKLSKYDDRHTIFIKNIVKKHFCDANADSIYKKHLLDLYEKYYLQ